MTAEKRLKNLQRVRVGLVAAIEALDEDIKEMQASLAPEQPRKRQNLKRDRIAKYADRYALK